MSGFRTNLGLMPYSEAFELQRRALEQVSNDRFPDLLLEVEHPPVYTLGANFHAENLPLPAEEYAKVGVAIEPTDRGGDVTYHGPGQLVTYPIFNLRRHGQDLHKWMRDLEEVHLVALRSFGLEGRRFAPHTGVWIGDRKICAIGVKVRRWTSIHGCALNCDNDLAPFSWIVPCGIQGFGVTSLSRELGRDVSVTEAQGAVREAYATVFATEFQALEASELLKELDRLEGDGHVPNP